MRGLLSVLVLMVALGNGGEAGPSHDCGGDDCEDSPSRAWRGGYASEGCKSRNPFENGQFEAVVNGNNKKKKKRICVIEGCNNGVRRNGKCGRHMDNQKLCKVDGCDSRAYSHDVCTKHLDDKNKPKCSVDGCDSFAQKKGVCVKHLDDELKPKCRIDGCNTPVRKHGVCVKHLSDEEKEKCKSNCRIDGCFTLVLKKGVCAKHLGDEHKIKCPIDNCNHLPLNNSALKTHLEHVHDVGEHQCDFCAKNRNTSIQFTDDKTRITFNICRGCYEIASGKKERKETEWSKYLDKNFGTEHLLLSDKSLASQGGCSLKRPDKLYTGIELVIQGECDEHQHCYWNGSYLCEQERISEIYDEPGICGKFLAVVRYNPDSYQVPEGKKRLKKEDRLALNVKLMKLIIENPEVMIKRAKLSKRASAQAPIHVFYICYNYDNVQICKEFPVTMLYDESDLEKLLQ